MAERRLSQALLVTYLVLLLWLVLFKLSYDIPAVVAEHRVRSVNVIPFLGVGQAGRSETVSNFLVFVPFGLLLGVNVKNTRWWRHVAVVLFFSLSVETLQLILAIGITDVTDVVMNTLGGLSGYVLYRLVDKVVKTEILDWIITSIGAVLCVAFILLRVLVFQVRY